MGWADSLPQNRYPKIIKGISSMVARKLVDYYLEFGGYWNKNLILEQG